MKNVIRKTHHFILSLAGCLFAAGCNPERLVIKGKNAYIIDAERVFVSHRILLNTDKKHALSIASHAAGLNWVVSSGGAFIYTEAEAGSMDNFIFKENRTGEILFNSSQIPTFWYITSHDNNIFQALLINVGIGMGKLEMACREVEDGNTSLSMNFLYTAITEKGNRLMDDPFKGNMQNWVAQLSNTIEKEAACHSSSNMDSVLQKITRLPGKFEGKRVVVTHTETSHAPPEKIFPLSCPVEEVKCIDGWRYDLIYSESGKNENNCIFRENMGSAVVLNKPGKMTYWYTTKREASKKFHAVLVTEDIALRKLEFELTQTRGSQTQMNFKYIYTGLSEEGNHIVDDALKENMLFKLSFIGKSFKHYAETGQLLELAPGQKLKLFRSFVATSFRRKFQN